MNIAGQYEGVKRERARKEGSRERGEIEREIKEKGEKEVMTTRKVEWLNGSMER